MNITPRWFQPALMLRGYQMLPLSTRRNCAGVNSTVGVADMTFKGVDLPDAILALQLDTSIACDKLTD